MSSFFPTYFLRGGTGPAGHVSGAAGVHAWRAVAGAPFELHHGGPEEMDTKCTGGDLAAGKTLLAERAAR